MKVLNKIKLEEFSIKDPGRKTRLNRIKFGYRKNDNHPVVLKQLLPVELLPSQIPFAAAVKKFGREIRILKKLKEVNGVVRILKSGIIEKCPYHLCLKAEGISLNFYKGSKEINGLAEILILISDVCNTVEKIHSKGIVHRDLSPEHIFVGINDQSIIIDFGMAEDITICGAQKFRENVRHDLQSIGLILYELITGKSEFKFGSKNFLTSVNSGLKNLNNIEAPPNVKAILANLIFSDSRIKKFYPDINIPGYQSMEECIEDLSFCIAHINQG